MEEIKRIPTKLEIKEFLISFSYETRKGYYREQKRRIKHIDKEEAKKLFKEWSSNIRTMSNVQILGIDEIKENKQELVL